MYYVIGETRYDFLQIKSCTVWDGTGKLWNEIDKISYGCSLKEATIIDSYDEAKKILSEIQNRISEIDCSNASILDQTIDERNRFDKASYVKKLKIFKIVLTLIEV